MEPLGRPGVLAAVLVAAAVVAVALAIIAVRRARRASREREHQLLGELRASREAMATLHQRVEELSDEVDEARRMADQDREYVITSLGDPDAETAHVVRLSEAPERPPASAILEQQLLGTLARHRDRSALRARAVDVVVRTVALGHGVRRALAPDVLDRAAAEAHVARRRSRRDRKREEREARRLLRAVKAQSRGRTQGDQGHAA